MRLILSDDQSMVCDWFQPITNSMNNKTFLGSIPWHSGRYLSTISHVNYSTGFFFVYQISNRIFLHYNSDWCELMGLICETDRIWLRNEKNSVKYFPSNFVETKGKLREYFVVFHHLSLWGLIRRISSSENRKFMHKIFFHTFSIETFRMWFDWRFDIGRVNETNCIIPKSSSTAMQQISRVISAQKAIETTRNVMVETNQPSNQPSNGAKKKNKQQIRNS